MAEGGENRWQAGEGQGLLGGQWALEVWGWDKSTIWLLWPLGNFWIERKDIAKTSQESKRERVGPLLGTRELWAEAETRRSRQDWQGLGTSGSTQAAGQVDFVLARLA